MDIKKRLKLFNVNKAIIDYDEAQRTYLIKVNNDRVDDLNNKAINGAQVDGLTIQDCFFYGLTFFEVCTTHSLKSKLKSIKFE